jgi:hypothetical protein
VHTYTHIIYSFVFITEVIVVTFLTWLIVVIFITVAVAVAEYLVYSAIPDKLITTSRRRRGVTRPAAGESAGGNMDL